MFNNDLAHTPGKSHPGRKISATNARTLLTSWLSATSNAPKVAAATVGRFKSSGLKSSAIMPAVLSSKHSGDTSATWKYIHEDYSIQWFPTFPHKFLISSLGRRNGNNNLAFTAVLSNAQHVGQKSQDHREPQSRQQLQRQRSLFSHCRLQDCKGWTSHRTSRMASEETRFGYP